MKRQTVFIMMVIALVLAHVVGASELPGDANDPIELKDYLAFAAMNNAGLQVAFEQWKIAVEQVPQAKSLPDPKFTYGYFIEEVETRVGPQRNKLEIMQTKDAFYEYTYLAKAIEIAKENLELIQHFEEVARTKYITAATGHPDVIRAQIEMARLEDRLKTLEELRKPIVARLNAVLNRQSLEMLPWPRKAQLRVAEVSREKMIELLRLRNPELEALDFELQAAKSKVDLAKKKFWPDVGVGVGWTDTRSAMNPGVSDSGKDPIILMFTMNLPIWREGYKAVELQAKANVRKASHQKKQAENTIIALAERSLYDFEDSDRKRKLYGDVLIPKGEELLGASETAYKAGTIDFLSLINAQQKLLEFQLYYERAMTDNQQELARLEMLVGAEL